MSEGVVTVEGTLFGNEFMIDFMVIRMKIEYFR